MVEDEADIEAEHQMRINAALAEQMRTLEQQISGGVAMLWNVVQQMSPQQIQATSINEFQQLMSQAVQYERRMNPNPPGPPTEIVAPAMTPAPAPAPAPAPVYQPDGAGAVGIQMQTMSNNRPRRNNRGSNRSTGGRRGARIPQVSTVEEGGSISSASSMSMSIEPGTISVNGHGADNVRVRINPRRQNPAQTAPTA